MKNPSLWGAMEHLDPLLIEEADRPVPRRGRTLRRTLAIVAAACLLLAVGVLAAETLLGFRILEVRNDEHGARHSLTVEDAVQFPAAQFGETVQERLAAGGDPITVLEEHPANEQGIAVSRIQIDVPRFDTYAGAAAYVGADIPLAPESAALAGHLVQEVRVSTNSNQVSLGAVYQLEETGVMFSAAISVEGGAPPAFGSYYGTGEVELSQETAETGTGCPVLIYRTAGEQEDPTYVTGAAEGGDPVRRALGMRNTCEAYFILDGIVYNIFLTETDDMAVMQRILDTY